MRIPIEEHKPWPGKVYRFHVGNKEGHDVEANLPSEEHARTVIDFYKDQEIFGLKIMVEHVPKVKKGFGRDPDLH